MSAALVEVALIKRLFGESVRMASQVSVTTSSSASRATSTALPAERPAALFASINDATVPHLVLQSMFGTHASRVDPIAQAKMR
eukprot:CAMPEP_0119103104 /NCGR_PEP_ID=MMETSP1180-20130426/1649_1 /TAXON_ID=3052 ORGANISM="Chlamydomonas cf sp, Strain CCMP681" /NCGR_SAMPLE_ID=MMETSP1180 /ASSEMBLY_ACC=CAM_ASM_000741 /LENGTH=83 /DNA_ID=CAMNT_0007087541 /DNA_START=94 /DNA_END=345 /DNA_ORIENTATION=+